jgi:peptidase S41-like protein
MNTSRDNKGIRSSAIRCGYYIAAAFSVLSALSACHTFNRDTSPLPGPVALDFTQNVELGWIDQSSASDSGSIIVDIKDHGSQLHVVSDHAQEKKISRRIDASSLRGRRAYVRVPTTFHSEEAFATATVRISVERIRERVDAWDSSTSQPATNIEVKTLQTAIDVPMDATVLQVELDVKGHATATFGNPQLLVTTQPIPRNAVLTSETSSALQSLALLVGYLRFFHPSDEVAKLEWPAFETEAVRRLLLAGSHDEIQTVLNWVTASVAPTARLYDTGHRSFVSSPPRGAGTKLTRWVRIGSGDDGDPYSSFRTGISEPSDIGVTLLRTTASQGCKRASVRLAAKVAQGSPIFELYIIPRRGSGTPSVMSHISPDIGSIEGDIPQDATEITYGVHVGGEGIADLREVELICEKRVLASFSPAADPEIFGTAYHLYTVTRNRQCNDCLRVTRYPETAYESSRDELDVNIGLGLRLRMPLALWTDGKRTFPEAISRTEAFNPLPPSDRASRIATVIDIWTTLRWFYPYFADLHIDWEAELAQGLTVSARAASADDLFAATGHLVAALRDDHAVSYRPMYDNGILPLVFHQVGSRLYFAGGIGAYKSALPKGSILSSIDGMPADVVVKQIASTISAATPAWRDAYLPFVLGEGPVGVMVSIRAMQPDGKLVTIGVPRLARSRYIFQKREERPANGSEIATGVYYIDAANIDASSWKALLPKLTSSRAIVCDLREGASPAAFQILAHFIDHEIKSPYWDKPIASPGDRKYERSQSSIYPSSPRLSARIVFVANGRTASSPETILQYAHAAGVGTVVGEPTGGTNGDVASFDSLGGLRIRFTGLRTLNQDGSAFHGHGIAPDIVIHPTVDGIRSGKDELLEAAVAHAVGP